LNKNNSFRTLFARINKIRTQIYEKLFLFLILHEGRSKKKKYRKNQRENTIQTALKEA